MLKNITTLVKKELLLEWRQKHTIFSVLLYVSCTILVLYMMAGQPESRIWNSLFWVAQLFIIVNTVSKSFFQERGDRMRYYYTLIPPVQFLLSKLIYGVVLSIAISLVSLGLFTLLLGNPLQDLEKFLFLCCVGSGSLSLLFTFLSAIAAQAKQNSALMAILGFPLAVPLLMILSKLSLSAVAAIEQEGWWNMAFILLSIDLLILGLACILFPFLWKE